MSNGILDSDQSKALHDLITDVEVSMAKKTMLEKAIKERQEESDQQLISEEKNTPATGTEKYVNTTRDHISKRNDRPLTEKNDLLAGPESVTSDQLKKSNL